MRGPVLLPLLLGFVWVVAVFLELCLLLGPVARHQQRGHVEGAAGSSSAVAQWVVELAGELGGGGIYDTAHVWLCGVLYYCAWLEDPGAHI